MKKSILAFMLFLMTFSIYAQSGQRDEDGERFAKELNLTVEQKEQMKALRETNRGAAKTIRSSSLTKEEKRASMVALHDDIRNEMSAILSPEQLIQWDAVQEKRKGQKLKRRRAMKELDMTDDQKQLVKLITENHRSSLATIKSSNQSKAEKRAGKNSLNEKTRTELERVLSADQLVKFDEIRSRRKKHRAESQGKRSKDGR